MQYNTKEINAINNKISFLKGKFSIKNMNSDEKVEFFNTFTIEQLRDVMECTEHVIALKNGRPCHLSDEDFTDF